MVSVWVISREQKWVNSGERRGARREHCETQEIRGPEARPARGDDLEGVSRRQARPASRHRVNRAVGRLVPDASAVTIAALIDEDELESVQRVERMGNADPLSRFVGVGRNW